MLMEHPVKTTASVISPTGNKHVVMAMGPVATSAVVARIGGTSRVFSAPVRAAAAEDVRWPGAVAVQRPGPGCWWAAGALWRAPRGWFIKNPEF